MWEIVWRKVRGRDKLHLPLTHASARRHCRDCEAAKNQSAHLATSPVASEPIGCCFALSPRAERYSLTQLPGQSHFFSSSVEYERHNSFHPMCLRFSLASPDSGRFSPARLSCLACQHVLPDSQARMTNPRRLAGPEAGRQRWAAAPRSISLPGLHEAIASLRASCGFAQQRHNSPGNNRHGQTTHHPPGSERTGEEFREGIIPLFLGRDPFPGTGASSAGLGRVGPGEHGQEDHGGTAAADELVHDRGSIVPVRATKL